MPTKVFSSRADADKLAFADRLARQEYGISYGQFCGTLLLDSIDGTGRLPQTEQRPSELEKRQKAFAKLKSISALPHNPEIGKLSDEEIRDMIASRYE